jgi:outer membrane protein
MKRVSKISALAAAMLVSGAASAYEAGDWIVRGGVVMVDPNADSSSLNVEGSRLDGTHVDVDEDTQLLLNVTYMASNHVGVELLAATPFEHTVNTDGLNKYGLQDVDLGKIKQLPPTLSAVWYPMPSNSKFQPFFGIGVNYTVFFDEDVSGEAKHALGADNLKLDDSWGLAGRIGMDYMINSCWALHAGAYYIDISTDAEVDTALGKAKVDVDVDPWVYSLGVAYRF